MFFLPRKTFALLASLPLAFGLSGCLSMEATINGEEGVPLSEIDLSGGAPSEVVLAGSDKVIITRGDALEITVEGSDEAKDALRFVLNGDLLGISRDESEWDASDWDENDQATIRVSLPAAPKELVVTGSGSMETKTLAETVEISVLGSGKFTSSEASLDALDVNLGGSGSAQLGTLTVSLLEINIGGSGSVSASGTAEKLDINLGGSGGAQLDDLKVDSAEIAVAGSGSVRLQSDGDVSASIMGSGSVDVTGTATCKEQALGSGSLNCPGGKKSSS